MKTITDAAEIAALYNEITDPDGAYATGRYLPGLWEQENCQEWAEYCNINGSPAKVYYIFDNAEAEVEDGGDMPWNVEHVSKIELAEKDEDGDYENI